MDFSRLEGHLKRINSTIYPDLEMGYHAEITKTAINQFVLSEKISKVLDIGCGRGSALKVFKENGLDATGITLGDEDLDICIKSGYNVHKMDMSFLEFEDNVYDLVWARHCLEHSPMPIITLFEFWRVLKDGGFLYVEVPEDLSPHLENPNHYSLLSDHLWQSLFRRVGFELQYRTQFSIRLSNWTDIFWSYWLKKDGEAAQTVF